MVRAQNSVPCGEFELVSPALIDADVDGRFTVGGRAEEESGFPCSRREISQANETAKGLVDRPVRHGLACPIMAYSIE